jgi:penicillin-binding protein 1A
LSLPVWIEFMAQALKQVPVMEPAVPEGVVNVGGEWFYDEYAGTAGVTSLGLDKGENPSQPHVLPMPEADEKRKILDLFR